MTVFTSVAEAQAGFRPSALAIGNFDGVHLGHLALIRKTVGTARHLGLSPSLLTFDPHPTAIVSPSRTPELICSLADRVRFVMAAGIEQVLVLPFTNDIACTSPNGFVSQILCDCLKVKAVVVGEAFRFGHRQAGTRATLEELGAVKGFVPQFLAPVSYRGELVSSTAVRTHLYEGRISRANRLLNRCFSLDGPVVSGHGIGSKQTVPTLNLRRTPGLLTPRGVYVTETFETTGQQRRWPSITNVGERPTFNGDELTIETYLLAPLEGATPTDISVAFRHYVRSEQKFPDPASLKQQIFRDVVRAQTFWRRTNLLPVP